MKINFSQIYEGWKNNLFPSKDMKPYIEAVAKERMSICEECPMHSKNFKTVRLDAHCTDCGCTLSAKLRCLSCECPQKKWLAVIDEKKEEEIKAALQHGK
jgi:hypothetical protein